MSGFNIYDVFGGGRSWRRRSSRILSQVSGDVRYPLVLRHGKEDHVVMYTHVQ